jgi:hypothetical protein
MEINPKQALGSGSTGVLAEVGSLPRVRLEPESETVTCVVLHGRPIARVDSVRQRVETGGVTLHLTSPSRARSAVALIRRCIDEATYHWQLAVSSP